MSDHIKPYWEKEAFSILDEYGLLFEDNEDLTVNFDGEIITLLKDLNEFNKLHFGDER